jgi:hypothetical protein
MTADPRLLNIHDLGKVGCWPADIRRIDRRSPYGNPFKIADMVWAAVALYGLNSEPNRRLASVAFYRAWLGDGRVLIPGEVSGDERGGALEYTDGSTCSVGQAARGFAAFGAQMDLAKVALPPRPDLEPLRGYRLACWCAPLPCHGDVILEWLDTHEPRPIALLPVCGACGEPVSWNQAEEREGAIVHRVCPRDLRRAKAGHR